MSEVPVKDRARRFGKSKYNLSRVPRVLLDLITVTFMDRYRTRPMQFFGLIAMICGGAGALLALGLIAAKIVLAIAGRGAALALGATPWLPLSVGMMVLGVQFVLLGLLGEMTVRAYYESQGKPIYLVREIVEHVEVSADDE